MARFSGWRFKLLQQMGAPATKANLRFLDAWQRAEGGNAAYNPLNTTQQAPGASAYNSVGVRNYGSPEQGLQATVETLNNGRYGAIVNLLRSGRATAGQLGQAVEASPWGTGGGVMRVLGEGGPAAAGPGPSSYGPGPSPSGDGGRREFVTSMIDAIGKKDTKASVGALTKLRRDRAMSAFAPDGAPAAAPGAGPVPVAGLPQGAGGDAGLEELIYDPMNQSIFDGTVKQGAYGGHGDHLHYANDNPAAMLAAIQRAQAMGIRVGENPYTDPVDAKHAPGSFHGRTFKGRYNGRVLGQGGDFTADSAKLKKLYRWLAANYG